MDARSESATVNPGARFIPAVLDFSVTDFCNADCDFCGFARSKMKRKPRQFADANAFERALPIIARRGIRYLNFQGGEPLLHPQIIAMVDATHRAGIKPSLITNGWKLPERADALADAGLHNLLVSLDSDDLTKHDQNRGMRNLSRRMERGIARMKERRVPVMASVTVSKLVDFDALPATLRAMGFEAVTFSYPRQQPFGSSSLVYDEGSEIIDFTDDELNAALEAILKLKHRFRVLNPAASVRDIQRHIHGEQERFPCVGGFKYFYMDWRLDVWRCEAWHAPAGSVFEFDHIADDRTHCTACIMSCYRDTSTLMHAGVAAADAAKALASARPLAAARAMITPSVAQSLGTTLAEIGLLMTLGR
ncbi:MAG TPA: radical SAM protein [Caulobacteraceae bacterium]|jgi:MoaA/NifB/PqqE/SkfB family radical SAM enzyme|nr:radical SAM protein [Caulobacteraceae bacterium]